MEHCTARNHETAKRFTYSSYCCQQMLCQYCLSCHLASSIAESEHANTELRIVNRSAQGF